MGSSRVASGAVPEETRCSRALGSSALTCGADAWRIATRSLLLFALDRPSLHRWCVIAFSQRQVSEFRLLSIGKCAMFWLGARSPGVDHNHDRERDWGPRTSSIRSISIGWRWVACHRNNTRSILPRFRQPWASGMIRCGMG